MPESHVKKVLPALLAACLFVTASCLAGCTPDAEGKHGIEHIHHYLKTHHYHSAYRRAHAMARRGHPRAQTILGLLYQYGVGVEQDIGKAIVWFEKAARQGEGQAAYELGLIFLGEPDGKSGKSGKSEGRNDLEKAEYWLNKAAERGIKEANLRLGLMYLNGDRVEKDVNHAQILLHRAAMQGSDQAREELMKIPAVKAAADTVSKSGKDYGDGLYNLRDSWTGYADIVTSVRAAAQGASNSP